MARAKTTAWALTFADLTTLLLTFFVLLLVILNDAESHVDRSIDSPFTFIQTNIVGTAVLLDESYHYYKTLLDDKKDKF